MSYLKKIYSSIRMPGSARHWPRAFDNYNLNFLIFLPVVILKWGGLCAGKI